MTLRTRISFSTILTLAPFFILYTQVDSARTRLQLSINSNPTGAEVFLDSIRLGVTPLIVDTLAARSVRLTLRYPDFETWETTLTIEPGVSLTLSPKLTPKYGFLTLRTSLPDAEIFVDSNRVGVGNLGTTKLPYGWHVVEVLHPETKKAVSNVYIGPGQIIQVATRFNHFRAFPTLYSVTVPGMTQWADGFILEGSLMVGTAALAGFLYLRWNTLYEQRYLAYVSKEAEYLVATNEFDATRLGIEYREFYKSAEQALKNRNAARTGALMAYGVSLIEALLFHSTTSSLDVTSRSYDPTFTLGFSFGFPRVTMGIAFN